MGKYSMKFDRRAKIQEKGFEKIGIERKEIWTDLGGVRKCSLRYDSGEDYFVDKADKVLNTAMVRMERDPRINESMRIVILGENTVFKIISVMQNIINGRRLTQLKVQRWVDE